MGEQTFQTDVLVVGAGMAGCRAAIEAHDQGARVMLATKGLFGRDEGATWMANVGYQCWGIYPHDTLDVQVEDSLRCGWFLNNQENLYAFLSHVPNTARDLSKWGFRFRTKDGRFDPIWQLGCSTQEGRSIISASYPRGRLGYEYSRVFPDVVRSRKIEIIEDMFLVDLLTWGGSVVGAVGLNIRTGDFVIIKSKATILATGGYQGLYKVTTANGNLTGDGHAIALRAGADMMDFEFNQTLPCALWPPEIAGRTISFTLLMDWDAHLYNNENERFMAKWDAVKMEHSTRAVISRAIFHEIKDGKTSPHGGVYLRVAHQPKRYLEDKLREYGERRDFILLKMSGIDLSKDSIETGYVMHYCQGGCNVNAKCETDQPGLYAIGEVASGSKDGSDRMMSNALPFCMAMGIIAGREAAKAAKDRDGSQIDKAQVEHVLAEALAPIRRKNGQRIFSQKSSLQNLVMREMGYGRTQEGLESALREITRFKEEVLPTLTAENHSRRFNLEWVNILEFRNLVLVAECIVRNALLRTESRGLHDRWDFSTLDPDWFKNIHLRLVNGELKQWTTPVEFIYWKPEPGSSGEPWRRGVQVREFQGWRADPLYDWR